MTRSDWIALAACVASFLALVPPFLRLMEDWKPKKARRRSQRDSTSPPPPVTEEQKPATEQHYGPFMKALVLKGMAVAIGMIEIISFSWVAYLFGVPVDVTKMSLPWTVAFFALFLVPGLLLLLAMINISSVFED